jgi:hypothetical protein
MEVGVLKDCYYFFSKMVEGKNGEKSQEEADLLNTVKEGNEEPQSAFKNLTLS